MATNNAYQMVTDRIIDMMNKGIIPWHRPWHFNGIEDGTAQAISYTGRRAYSLLNQWLLGEPGEYLTFNQIKERKGSIRKGEKARMVVFFKQQSYVEKDPETGKEEVKTFRNSVAYLQGWISALKNDNKMIVWAASRAEKAARYIIGGPDALKPAQI